MGNLEVLEEYDVYVISYLTLKGWEVCSYGSPMWSKDGCSVRDCHYYGENCSGNCTDCYDRTELTRDEAYAVAMKEQDATTPA